MMDSLEIAKRLILIKDNGPIYNEFIHDAYIHEPWNAFSSLFFFVPVLFWIWKLRGTYSHHKIIVAVLPLLFLNGLGSTLFHAFRNEPSFLLLDWLPASLMSIVLSVYFWTKVLKKWYWGFLTVCGLYGIAILTIISLSRYVALNSFAPNIGYFFVGLALFLPILIILYRVKFQFYKSVLLTFIFLVLALFFRVMDYPTPNPFPEFLPQGTHFLWHIFSSFAVFTLGFFIYRLNEKENQPEYE